MPAPYLAAPAGGGDRPPFEIVKDTGGDPPSSTDMVLTIDFPDPATHPLAPELVTKTTGDRYEGSAVVVASQTGDLGWLCRMDRSSSAPGDVDYNYNNLTGVTVKKLGVAVTSVTAGETYVVHINVPA